MKYCSNCGKPMDDNDVFCGNCGKNPLYKTIPATAPFRHPFKCRNKNGNNLSKRKNIKAERIIHP